ncbi:hypothetical protein KIN20_000695 [Parelaphostrongylus tenuis]|uniref:Uncharacterized protein n=1 Tax=Parelaphostrongylus tenuis TaxID=148309 RepID=A0AAD5QE24_PARTN|nr:hypothetical protein KIN20_000695 [Parelaphostrongylus tenuis]
MTLWSGGFKTSLYSGVLNAFGKGASDSPPRPHQVYPGTFEAEQTSRYRRESLLDWIITISSNRRIYKPPMIGVPHSSAVHQRRFESTADEDEITASAKSGGQATESSAVKRRIRRNGDIHAQFHDNWGMVEKAITEAQKICPNIVDFVNRFDERRHHIKLLEEE